MRVGGLLYAVRSRKPFFYGLMEVIAGVAAIWVSVSAEADGFGVRTIGILSGIYVIVRGLDNMNKRVPVQWEWWWKRLNPEKAKVSTR